MTEELPFRIWDFDTEQFVFQDNERYDEVRLFRAKHPVERLARFLDPPAWNSFDASCAAPAVTNPSTSFIRPSLMRANVIMSFLEGTVAHSPVTLEDAFEMGYSFGQDVLNPQSREDSRAIGRLLQNRNFELISEAISRELNDQGFDSFTDADSGIVAAKAIIKAALARPFIPTPQGEGDMS